MFLFILACSGKADPDSGVSFELTLEVDTVNPFSALATVQGSADESLWIEVVGPLGVTQRTPAAPATSESTELAVHGLRPGARYRMQAVGSGGALSAPVQVDTEASAHELPAWSTEGSTDSLTLFAPAVLFPQGGDDPTDVPPPPILAVDTAGEVVWAFEAPGDSVLDATPVRVVGDEIWVLSEGGVRGLDLFGHTFLDLRPPFALHHDLDVSDDERIFALSYETRGMYIDAVSAEVAVLGDVLVEIDAQGDVVWEWRLLDHLDPQRLPSALAFEELPEEVDWSHANSIIYDEEADWVIVSLRHQNWVIAVDRSTGELAWTFGEGGDFTLESGEWMSAQHAARLLDGNRLALYDNGNTKNPQRSRAVEYALDFDSMTATESFVWEVPVFTETFGEVEFLGSEGYLVTAAGIRANGESGQLAEVTSDGEVSWSLEIPYSEFVFQAERLDWLTTVE